MRRQCGAGLELTALINHVLAFANADAAKYACSSLTDVFTSQSCCEDHRHRQVSASGSCTLRGFNVVVLKLQRKASGAGERDDLHRLLVHKVHRRHSGKHDRGRLCACMRATLSRGQLA